MREGICITYEGEYLKTNEIILKKVNKFQHKLFVDYPKIIICYILTLIKI